MNDSNLIRTSFETFPKDDKITRKIPFEPRHWNLCDFCSKLPLAQAEGAGVLPAQHQAAAAHPAPCRRGATATFSARNSSL